jgi:hypothetical protein
MSNNPFRPNEGVLVHHDDSFFSLGLKFDPRAEYAGCRICGRVYQSYLDREVYFFVQSGELVIRKNPITNEVYLTGEDKYIKVYDKAGERRQRWRELHTKRNHTSEEVDKFTRTGFALTPEAANKLAPYGFAPVGNLHSEIVHAMAEAPRAPEEDSEGR